MAKPTQPRRAKEPVKKIEYYQLLEHLADPHYPDKKLEDYVTFDPKRSIGMAPVLIPNKNVTFHDSQSADERARGSFFLGILNAHYRNRRKTLFDERIEKVDPRAIILADGDSWFQYPIKLLDVIDWLLHDYNVYCVSGAGDELSSINRELEYIDHWKYLAVHRKLNVRALLFSAGGNDIAAKHLANLLLPFKAGKPAADSLDPATWIAKKTEIIDGYQKLVTKIRSTQKVTPDDFIDPNIPILIHGYDYANPLPPQFSPLWPMDGWLGAPLREKGYLGLAEQKALVREIIEQMNADLIAFASNQYNVHFIDNRGLIGKRWFDELHPKNPGFKDVASKFKAKLVSLNIP